LGWPKIAGLGIALVVAGQFSGWNFGLMAGGWLNMLIATLLMALLCGGLALCVAELSTALPSAGGVFVYAQIKSALLDGYNAVKPLTATDRQTLALFLMLRDTTYLGWIHTRRGTPTAIEMAPMLIERACTLAREYLRQ
jgi:hypothetical protein